MLFKLLIETIFDETEKVNETAYDTKNTSLSRDDFSHVDFFKRDRDLHVYVIQIPAHRKPLNNSDFDEKSAATQQLVGEFNSR